MAISDEALGLRERKRVRTRMTIARAALELFDRQGFHETPIAQIAEAADVSPRTVSGYFPHKEDLVFPDSEEAFQSLDQRLRERPPVETTADALRGWIETWVAEQAGRDEELVIQRRIVEADEGLRAYERRLMLRAQDAIAAAIGRDLGVSATELEPRMAAAATITVFEVLGQVLEPTGICDPGDQRLPRAQALEVVDRALLFIGAGIRALRAGDPGGPTGS
jgi:AcrR family transcriptional regulator